MHAGCSAHQRIGADGVGVTATIVAVVAFVNVAADLRGRLWVEPDLCGSPQTQERAGSPADIATKPRPHSSAKPADRSAASSHLSRGPRGQPRSPWPLPGRALSSTQSTELDLLAGPGVVDAHAGHPRALVASGTGLAVEAGHGVDAAGAREARVSVSTLWTTRREVRPLPVTWDTAPGLPFAALATQHRSGQSPHPGLPPSWPATPPAPSPGGPSAFAQGCDALPPHRASPASICPIPVSLLLIDAHPAREPLQTAPPSILCPSGLWPPPR